MDMHFTGAMLPKYPVYLELMCIVNTTNHLWRSLREREEVAMKTLCSATWCLNAIDKKCKINANASQEWSHFEENPTVAWLYNVTKLRLNYTLANLTYRQGGSKSPVEAALEVAFAAGSAVNSLKDFTYRIIKRSGNNTHFCVGGGMSMVNGRDLPHCKYCKRIDKSRGPRRSLVPTYNYITRYVDEGIKHIYRLPHFLLWSNWGISRQWQPCG
ncbi:hypothetical protein TRVL_08808 [Trypanosoma vivax]|nr:hypothetical protein TRVL_08808 [Trypanosoma vivax]